MTSQDPMFSAEDTPVNHLAKPAKGKAKKIRDTSFRGSPKPFATYDPDTQSWKMYPAISLWDSEPYKDSWPRSGMTVDGIAYQLPPSAPRTFAIGFSSSLHQGPNSDGLWPTATTQDHATRYSQGGMPLGMAVRLWPTPVTTKLAAGKRSFDEMKKWWQEGYLTEEEFRSMTAGNGGRLNPTWVEWLMGFPTGWTDLEDSETPSSHKSPNTSDGS
jgi:hypothetical protein